ncbi:MAG: DUF4834 family protein [Prevotella sp.]|jgi:ABC-type transport system involved in cytochrome bd biosynthesis fused ATPase/permease subunit|nr:DUF4834 family protein [Prevotella sp.]
MAFLKFILLLFVAGLIALIFIAYSFYKRIHDTAKEFHKQMNGQQRQPQNRTYGEQEGVVDPRDPDKANQKIIPKDEGEYVDYEEEK